MSATNDQGGASPPQDDDGLVVRQAQPGDRTEMISLCRESLGWRPEDPSERFFAWKHDENPFGPSPAWVAQDADGRLAGVRVFMRWGFVEGTRRYRAVRAVDTATRPDLQGRGIFRRLTTGALPDLVDDGVDHVFNTPNDQSRPGYLKMGWQEVGRVPVAMRPRGVVAALAMRGARTAANKWSEPTEVGLAAVDFFADDDQVAALLGAWSAGRPGRRTDRSVEYLRWRYSFPELHYRVVPLGERVVDGAVVFRLRRRGTALEAAICEVLAPSSGSARAAVGWLLRRSGADYALRCDDGGSWRAGFVGVPGFGPVLTWRPLADSSVPTMDHLDLSLGDVELF